MPILYLPRIHTAAATVDRMGRYVDVGIESFSFFFLFFIQSADGGRNDLMYGLYKYSAFHLQGPYDAACHVNSCSNSLHFLSLNIQTS